MNEGIETVNTVGLNINNIQGKLVYSEIFNAYGGANQISTGKLSTGIYFVNLNFEGESVKRKVFVP